MGSKVLPKWASIFISGVKLLYNERITFSKPLNTDSIMMRAALPIKTPSMDMPEIILMTCIFLPENRYRLAMYTEVFNYVVSLRYTF